MFRGGFSNNMLLICCPTFQLSSSAGHDKMQVIVKWKTVLVFTIILIVYLIYSYAGRSEKNFERDSLTKESKYRNWIRKDLIEQDSRRAGFGEHGTDVILTDSKEIAMNEVLYQKTGFSVVVSDKISINRSLPEVVHPDCQKFEYYAHLPAVSVIIIFHNEVKSVLLRTLSSIINRTPPELLHEVILVNDNSTSDDLYQPLQEYVKQNFAPKVKIKNLPKRSGLIVTRMEGARMATGEVLVFIDSHVEVHFNWLPPLLQPIVDNRRIATLPIVDYFDAFTFGYIKGQEDFQGNKKIR